MSARGPFARYDDTDDVVRVGAHEWRVYDGDVMVDELNAAHADRVAAELEAAAESQIGHGEIVTMRAVRDALRARAKAIREGGGK